MKNKLQFLLFLIFIIFFNLEVKSQDQFDFDVTEVEILDKGNKFFGNSKGTIKSNNGVIINANQFEYDKNLNLLIAKGEVELQDKVNNYLIYSTKITYDKNNELIITDKKSRGVSVKDNSTIKANKFEFYRNLNLINAIGDVEVHDKLNEYLIYSEKITYDKNKELITTQKYSKGIIIKDNIKIKANKFEYLKNSNILTAYKNVFIEDDKRKYNLNSDYVKYSINKGKIISKGNSKLVNLNDETVIASQDLEYNITKDIFNAKNDVIYENKLKNYKIYADKITYYKKNQKIQTFGKTSADIKSKYKIKSSDVLFLQNKMQLSSNDKTIITSNQNIYNTSRFKYYIDEEFLKAEKILVISNYTKPQNDKYYFENGMINLKNQDFLATDTRIDVQKDVFNNVDNDPRILGKSSKKEGDLTFVNKGIFTSCKINDDCPPWAIEASEIKHDQSKKEIFYKNAIFKVYNVPVLYFPKFFHPDPSVKRRSGVLKPTINNSNVLGSSLTVPYYHVLSDNSDITLAPSRFDNGSNMLQNEFRAVGKNSNVLVNFGHVRDYKSSTQNIKKNISYIFSNLNLDLDLPNFKSSELDFKFEKVTNDNFLKVFESNFNEYTTSIKPSDTSVMNNELKLRLNHEDFNLTTGFASYENLQKSNNDRYQYILPYYNFDKTIFLDVINSSLYFSSNGSNDLNNTNQLKTKITNNLSYSSSDYFSKSGFVNNFNINFKNFNSVGKNTTDYKTSPQVELSSLFEVNSSIPFKKKVKNSTSFLTPKTSFRFNPSDMKNHKSTDKTINVGNIFAVDRFGLGDSYESGRSITLGVDYRNEKSYETYDNTLKELNKYFEIKLATVLRDKEENFIPSKTTLNEKTSNIFGSASTNLINNLQINYNFALDEKLNDIEYSDLSTTLFFDNFSSTFNFVKSINEMGDENFLENSTSYKFDENNSIKFNTRRNRKINLTEFYDLVYEYKNDCLVAGVKYKKTYYEDKDLTPTENLFFSVSFIPLTTYEHKVDNF